MNQADESELKAIKYFQKDRNATEYFEEYLDGKRGYFQYATPIYIKPYCLSCHGKKEYTLPTIQQNYENGYNYEVGDLRGIVSVKIPVESIYERMYYFIKDEIIAALFIFIAIALSMYMIFKHVSLHVKKIESKAHDLSLKDNLTQLYNRHFLQEYHQHHEHFHDENQHFIVGFLDIDHFKSVNDTYGHEFGDVVLSFFAKKLLKYTRSEDIVVRYGGEEFLIILYNISYEEATNKLEMDLFLNIPDGRISSCKIQISTSAKASTCKSSCSRKFSSELSTLLHCEFCVSIAPTTTSKLP
jgi:c-di-GMP phosphodiesterase